MEIKSPSQEMSTEKEIHKPSTGSSEQRGDQIFRPHDHAICIAQTVAAAEERCHLERTRLTETRRKVLDLLLQEHRPLGAYAILEHLQSSGQKAQPPVAYRALDFLIENGLAHRIESRNAYIACSDPAGCHAPSFFICQQCDQVAETHSPQAQSPLQSVAEEMGFLVESELKEASGTCPTCQQAS